MDGEAADTGGNAARTALVTRAAASASFIGCLFRRRALAHRIEETAALRPLSALFHRPVKEAERRPEGRLSESASLRFVVGTVVHVASICQRRGRVAHTAGVGVTERLGRASSRHPWRTILAWVGAIVLALVLAATLLPGNLTTNGHVTGSPESTRAERLFRSEERRVGRESRPGRRVVLDG